MNSVQRSVTVCRSGPQALVQDGGRNGYAHLGVGHAGAADRESFELANRLVGNPVGCACVEVTFGGLELVADHTTWIAVTGAPVPVQAGGRAGWIDEPLRLLAGETLSLGTPVVGLRSYLAVRGGVLTTPELGSRSTDTMSGLGTSPLATADVLPIGPPPGMMPGVDLAPRKPLSNSEKVLPAEPGPRLDWFDDDALRLLYSQTFEVSSDANRVGVRLHGPVLPRATSLELASEGVVCGALQAPPDGRLTLFLADHPVTGGYPVIAVVPSYALSAAAQLRPGQQVRFQPLGRQNHLTYQGQQFVTK